MLEPICLVHGRGSGSLDDIMLEDNSDMDKELDDFFGSEAEVGQFLKPLTLSYMGAIAFTKLVFSELILSLPGSKHPLFALSLKHFSCVLLWEFGAKSNNAL